VPKKNEEKYQEIVGKDENAYKIKRHQEPKDGNCEKV
jgi:hypothetical protein